MQYRGKQIGNSSSGYLGFAVLVFLLSTFSSASDTAYSNFAISLTEIPEWAPGYPPEIRRIVVDGKGLGTVVITKETDDISEVSEIALFQYNPDSFAHWENGYIKYEDFYGVDEDSNGTIVEGGPDTSILSFFYDGQLIKSIRISGAHSYQNETDIQFQPPATVIELKDQLSAYAEHADPQARQKYYITAMPYNENEKYWLLKSTSLQSIPTIDDISDDKRELAVLRNLIENIPTFLALEETIFLKLRKGMGLSLGQHKAVFRISEGSDRIVQIILMRSTFL